MRKRSTIENLKKKKKATVPAPELLSLSKMEVNRSVNEIRRVYLRLIRMKAIRLDSVPNTKPRDIISNLMKQMERNLVFFSSISNDAERQKWERGGRPVDPTKKKRKEKKKKRKKRERERERERERKAKRQHGKQQPVRPARERNPIH